MYCKNRCDPRLSSEAADCLQSHYISVRKKMVRACC